MKCISFNVNGLRAIVGKNFEEDLNLLFLYMYSDEKQDSFIEVLDRIVNNIKNIAKIKIFD